MLSQSIFPVLLAAMLGTGQPLPAHFGPAPAHVLLAKAEVDSRGIFIAQLLVPTHGEPLPAVRLAAAPALGQTLVWTPQQINQLLAKTAPDLVTTNWSGADRIRIGRRSRILNEAELKELITARLQQDYAKEKGHLELHLNRPWNPMMVPDEPLSIKVLDLPATGLSPYFILRFELHAGEEVVGSWQASLQAKVWSDILVARSSLRRGELLREADVEMARRDVLSARELLESSALENPLMELSENIRAGAPLYTRSVRVRPVVRRGKLVDAFLQEGGMSITMRVEVLEDGIPGQVVRVRNPQSRREFNGKVRDEQTVLVFL